jgi:hypothetical protein
MMGTRADFYVGRGELAEWIGSIAWDGYPDGVDETIRASTDEAMYRERVAAFINGRNDGTIPEHGWPWPWENSRTTGYAYALDDGRVWASSFGGAWWPANGEQPEEPEGDAAVFPDMTNAQNVTMGARSGTVVIVGK